MFTWQAGSGTMLFDGCMRGHIVFALASQEFPCRDVSHQSIEISEDGITASGVSINQTLRDMKLEYCIVGKKEVEQQGGTCLRAEVEIESF